MTYTIRMMIVFISLLGVKCFIAALDFQELFLDQLLKIYKMMRLVNFLSKFTFLFLKTVKPFTIIITYIYYFQWSIP